MARTIRIIQLAVFGSNLGDNANVAGLRAMLARNLGDFELRFTDWEMLDYSWGLDTYDEADIDRVNGHDLLIIGGGGFFEIVTANDSWTGTRIAIPRELFEKIRIPVVFHGLGVHTLLEGPVAEGVARFKSFLDLLFSSDQYLVSTRNDGSLDRLRTLVGSGYADRFHVVPDGGFFTEVGDFDHPEIPAGRRTIAVNLGGDLLDKRFQERAEAPEPAPPSSGGADRIPPIVPADYDSFRSAGHAGFDAFLGKFSRVLRSTLAADDDIHIVYIPHIYRDIEAGYHFLHAIGFPYCRRRITMAPYLNGKAGQDYIFDTYRKCVLTIGMRFHANVVPIGLGVPSIGLCAFPIDEGVFRELGIPERGLDANGADFEDRLHALIGDSLRDGDAVRRRYAEIRARLVEQTESFHHKIAAML